jgi:hypothetical protein
MSKLLVIQSLDAECWADHDVLIEHACFQILCDFIEQEQPYQSNLCAQIAWYGAAQDQTDQDVILTEQDQQKVQDWKRLYAIYDWWIEAISTNCLDEKEVDRYLVNLIGLRGYLWD